MGRMMINLQDDEVIRRLELLADAHQTSPEAEAVAILERVTGVTTVLKHGRSTIAKRIAELTPNISQTDSTILVQEERSR